MMFQDLCQNIITAEAIKMRPIFWFIVLPVLIEALTIEVSEPEKLSLTSLTSLASHSDSDREAKHLFSVFEKYAQNRQDIDGVNPAVADAITVGLYEHVYYHGMMI